MLRHSRVRYPRSAVAFFSMNHFQVRYRAALNAENVYMTLSSCVLPRDRLLLHSGTGRGSSRVLVLDNQQKVKGVLRPLCCLPHPATIPGGSSSLGVTVENYLKTCASTAHLTKTAAETTTAAPSDMPMVLVIVTHPDGLALIAYYADGRLALPLVILDFTALKGRVIGSTGEGKQFGAIQTAKVYNSRWSRFAIREQLQSLLDQHVDVVARCATLYWITRSESDCLSLRAVREFERFVRGEEMVEAGESTSAPLLEAAEHSVSFSDPRWIALPDLTFDTEKLRTMCRRDVDGYGHLVDPAGLQGLLTGGLLLLDHVPRSVKTATPSSASRNGEQTAA
jgi:hypothetical protein